MRPPYYTEYNVDVTQRIEEGKTIFFEGVDEKTKRKAEAKAKSIRRYIYNVFAYNKHDRLVLVGYAVPK
ncbi:hypothetical protein [Aquimarina spongiae]|uniref:Uncharacterized protein n=1 Tax=Aquimarina spongiae TaxID=570521 RepID=A0A1M6GJF2_9FLAO|nr:hypothetical protein [Aquimarina spongiae]SHJ10059.1 hypothetical protein SAMN04488508_105312 [Aquimarina spongiae]